MLRVSLAQVRRHAVRLLATGLAIVIAVGFVVATLVLDQTSKNTVDNAVAAPYRQVSAVIVPTADAGTTLSDHQDLLAEVTHLSGVAAAVADRSTSVQVKLPGSQGYRAATLNNSTPDAALDWLKLSAGRLPAKDGEIAVGQGRGVAVGATATLVIYPADGGTPQLRRATVTGLVDLKGAAALAGSAQLFATDQQAQAWGATDIQAIRVAGALGTGHGTGGDQAALRSHLATMLASDHQRRLQVLSGDQAADQAVGHYTRGTAGLTAVLLVFAAVSVLVCALVIANTYAVLLAQRVRELALLRCVGATGRQLLRGVLIESFVTGVVASAIGVLAGIGLAASVSAITARLNSPIPLSGVSVPLTAVLTGMTVGVLVTMLSSLVPALRATTRISPLAAMRPTDAIGPATRSGLLRRFAGVALLVPGVLILLSGARAHNLPVAVFGGAGSFVAVLLLARWVVPIAVALVGRIIRDTGVPGKLAARNAVRNPQRTAATATALIIGVTLTTAMVVGAASTRVSADHGLDHAFPTDLVVANNLPGNALPASLPGTLAGLPHVAAAAGWPSADVRGPGGTNENVLGLDRASADRVVRSASGAGIPAPGTISTPRGLVSAWGKEGSLVRLRAGRRSIQLRVHVVPNTTAASMNASDLAELAPNAPLRTVWVRLEDGLSSGTVSDTLDAINDASAAASPSSFIQGTALERNAFNRIITTLLLIVTGLLGVAVVIAIIGVGNTLALSVVERQQESGLLRALGLTRGQLRRMLLWEAALIAGVAAILGVLLGSAYGVLGTATVLGGRGPTSLVIPWTQVVAIIAVATVAGAVASVLPARRAARTSPIVAIAG